MTRKVKREFKYRIGDPYPEDLPTCVVPWTSICLAANGDIKPCCQYDAKGAHNIYLRGSTLESAWDDYAELRQQMINKEKPEKCISCWKAEDMLGNSRRQWMLEKLDYLPETYTAETPLDLNHMDLNFGNTCNLKCRMCGSWGSTHWFKEDKKLQAINRKFERHTGDSDARSIDVHKWRSMEDKLSNMERIDFKGGEPMMQDGMFEVLQMLVNNGSAKNVILGYVTNGTKTPERLKDLWPHFKQVILNISAEATGNLYQYIRGSNIQTIEQLEQNLKWYDQFDNVKGHFSVAISTYNIFDLQNLCEWMERVTSDLRGWKTLVANRASDSVLEYQRPNQFSILVNKPAYLDANNMPPHLKQRVLETWNKGYHQLDYMREHLKKPNYNEEQWQLFKQFTQELDKLRDTNVLDYIPQLEGEF
mgnify:CR=1 FL=1|tara:strand:- start:1026 stop:2282 length:1257 start_codon:yes stop_codon:yes gene_type:complete